MKKELEAVVKDIEKRFEATRNASGCNGTR